MSDSETIANFNAANNISALFIIKQKKTTGITVPNGTKNVETMVVLNLLDNFGRGLEMALNNVEINLIKSPNAIAKPTFNLFTSN